MRKAFTLIELLLYVTVLGVVVLGMSIFLSVLQHQGARSGVIAEVEDQSLAPMEIMTQVIRNATSSSSPAIGTSGSSATILGTNALTNPTVFSLNTGAIMMKEGTAAAVALTTGKVIVSGLTFTNMTTATSPGTIRIQYTVSYNNPDSMPEYTYTKSTTGSATLR